MTTEPTAKAMGTAVRLYWLWLGKPTLTYNHLTEEGRDLVNRNAAIIDREMGLPEITAERDRLRVALIEARVRLGFPDGKQPTDFFSIDYHAVADTVRLINATLLKHEGKE